METAIGVFSSRERAEETVKELLEKHVPQDAIVFLTRSESEAMTLGKSLGAFAGGFVGGATGVTAGMVAATLFSIPGIGRSLMPVRSRISAATFAISRESVRTTFLKPAIFFAETCVVPPTCANSGHPR
jgi:hypothetical protein